MKRHLFAGAALVLLLVACAQNQKPQVAAVATAPAVIAPTTLILPEVAPGADPALLSAAQLNLHSLGYAAGKLGNTSDPAFQKAVEAFEKDQGLPQDSQVTEALSRRMNLMRAELLKSAPAAPDIVFVYDDGVVSRQALGLMLKAPQGQVANTPTSFMHPVRPSAMGSYQLGIRSKDGIFSPTETVSCRSGHLIPANVPIKQTDVIEVECRSDGKSALQWRSLYSPSLGQVVRQEHNGVVVDLVAMRPFTGDWPSAARTGLDWAVTHSLDGAPSSPPVEWSSTGVTTQFEIKVTSKIDRQDTGLSGENAELLCRRFDMARIGQLPAHYLGIACQNTEGGWFLPGTKIQFDAPTIEVKEAPKRNIDPNVKTAAGGVPPL